MLGCWVVSVLLSPFSLLLEKSMERERRTVCFRFARRAWLGS